ncbi:MAG: type II and III secretion system protein family protein [Alphaproteobacteria bacterium]|nr:type II and III secretion system protein family protein [Alphaproteobacteria bacterium]
MNPKRRQTPWRIALLVAAGLLAGGPATTRAAGGDDFYSALGGAIQVEINKGTPVHLSAAATSVAIADPAIADVQVISPRLLMVAGRGVGETSILAVDARDNVILQGTVNVTHNLSRLTRALNEMNPAAKISATSADNAIVLKGKVDSPVLSEKLQRLASGFLSGDKQQVINMLDTSAGDQVMLKVRVVELRRSELKRFGINWESVINSGNFVFGLAQGRDFIGNTLNAAGSLNTFDRSSGGENGILAGFNDGRTSLNTMIDALETDGLISVLAEPNLTTRSGQQASFLAGGEIPIPVQGENNAVTIQYRQFGVSLQFTPIVLSKDKISLTVLPEVSALSEDNRVTTTSGVSVPSITTRRASTTVDLGSGQTFAVAGLLRSDNANSVSKFPFLGDLPVLGALFRSSSFRNDQTELVILVTPYIVKPVDDPSKLLTPLDGLNPANDFERIVLGRLTSESPMLPDSAKPEAAVPGQSSPDAAFAGVGGHAGFLLR